MGAKFSNRVLFQKSPLSASVCQSVSFSAFHLLLHFPGSLVSLVSGFLSYAPFSAVLTVALSFPLSLFLSPCCPYSCCSTPFRSPFPEIKSIYPGLEELMSSCRVLALSWSFSCPSLLPDPSNLTDLWLPPRLIRQDWASPHRDGEMDTSAHSEDHNLRSLVTKYHLLGKKPMTSDQGFK